MSTKKKSPKASTSVNLTPEARDALAWVEGWSRFSKSEIISATLEALPRLGQPTTGAMIGSVPEQLRPDFARMVLHRLIDADVPELQLRDAASETPPPGGTGVPRR